MWTFLIIGFSISTILLLGTFIFIRIYYVRKRRLYIKSKKYDEELKEIDFENIKKTNGK
ncbi:MAG: hypothetical protein M1365_02555 [Actinobacteria bacterium]|nr:hypothetical protein [Actinomycetota bacterium]